MALTAELAGMPLEEIAQRMDSNVNAVYKPLHDARQRLKRGLETAGYTAEDVRSAFAEPCSKGHDHGPASRTGQGPH